MTNTIQTLRGGMTWAYRASAAEANAGGGSLSLEIAPVGVGYEFEMDSLTVGPDDYSGAETIQIDIIDENDDIVRRISTFTMDNQTISHPTQGETPAPDIETSVPYKFTVSGLDKVHITTSALAQNETLTVNMRARIRSQPPTVTWSSSGTLGTVTTSYNKVI